MNKTKQSMPVERAAKIIKFRIAGQPGYLMVGLYPDGTVGEIFVKMSKQGSTLGGFLDAFAIAVSLGLQYGVPLEVFVEKFSHMRFEPAGYTDNPEIPQARSVIDYVMRWLARRYLPEAIAAKVTAQPAVVLDGSGPTKIADEELSND